MIFTECRTVVDYCVRNQQTWCDSCTARTQIASRECEDSHALGSAERCMARAITLCTQANS